MIRWQDDGIVLAARPHGERDAILAALTFAHGRHLGLVKGGVGTRARPLLQPGNQLQLVWTARLLDHLGHYTVEPVRLAAGRLMEDPLRLTGLASAAALLEHGLAEREAHPQLYAALLGLIERMSGGGDWLETYVRFELVLLAELGFGLDLTVCAVTGATEGLALVSPRTGRAVTLAGAGDHADRLLPLPGFLVGQGAADRSAIAEGLRLCGHFLKKHLMAPAGLPLPAPRERLADLVRAQESRPEVQP